VVLLEKVGKSNTEDSTIRHKAEVLPEAKAEGPQREDDDEEEEEEEEEDYKRDEERDKREVEETT
jgi:hypothetical protein